jgi:sRNA-binding protein
MQRYETMGRVTSYDDSGSCEAAHGKFATSQLAMTFADLRRQMDEARAKAEKAAREEQAKQNAEPPPANKPEDSVDIDFDVKTTGQRR